MNLKDVFPLLLLVLPSVLASPALLKEDQCPLITLKDEALCRGQSSECWSPGQGDVDCPNNGLCCFDGCVNTCRGEERTQVIPPPLCAVEYEQRKELVTMDHCEDVPVPETCTQITKQNCRNECELKHVEKNVKQETECCKTTQVVTCRDTPCIEDEVHYTEQPVHREVCEVQEGFCWTIPTQGEECLKPSNKCKKNTFLENVAIRQDCKIKNAICDLTPKTICEVTTEPTLVLVPTRVCKDICVPYLDPLSHCTPKTTRKECRPITKEMEYTVPVERC